MSKKLFLCTCVDSGCGLEEKTFDVYVVAEDANQAGDLAIKKVRDIGYRYTNYTKEIKLIAGEEHYKASHPLIVHPG